MATFITTFNMVMPMFGLVFAGYLVRRAKLLPEEVATRLNNLCYKVLLPCSMFKSALTMVFNMEYFWMMVFLCVAVFVSVPILCLVIPRFVPDRRQAGAVVQTCFRTNTAIFGLGMMESVCGPDSLAPMVVVVATVVMCFNICAVIELTYFSGESAGDALTPKKLFLDLAKNPLILSTLGGILVGMTGFEIPKVIMKPISDLAVASMPIAMISVGMRFNLKSITGNRKIIGLATLIKMVIMPIVWTGAAYFVGFRGLVLCAIYFQQASTTITIAPAIAEAYGCDGQISGEILIVQTAASLFTMFTGVYILQIIGIL